MGPLYALLSQDLLLLPLFHCKGPHSPNIAKGLVCYTRCPGNLHGDRERGISCRQKRQKEGQGEWARDAGKNQGGQVKNSSTCS